MENLQGFETWFFGSLITALLIIIGYFLKKNLEEIQHEIKELKEKHHNHETRIQVNEYRHSETIKLSNEILAKVRAITPE
jgi:hypothetical protein